MRILVTGGAGYVGSLLCHRLVRSGHDVTILDTLDYGVGPVLGLHGHNLRCIQGDISDPRVTTSAVNGQDFVFHLAGMVGFPRCQREFERAHRVNVKGTEILKASMELHGVTGCVNASSGSVYGKISETCTEDTTPNPQSEYGRTKLEAEEILGDSAVHLRFATLFGVSPCMRFDLLPNNFAVDAVKHGFLVLYRPEDRRTFLPVRDAVTAYVEAMDRFSGLRGARINVGSDSMNLTKRQLALSVQRATGCHLHVQQGGVDPDFRDYEVDYSKQFELLGLKFSDTLDSTIQEVCDVAGFTNDSHNWRYPQ